MHARNPYCIPPDFEALGRTYPPLAKYVRGRTINFHDDAAQRCLTQALLKCDFNVEIELPPDRLCPPVPNRLNYVLWIQDIVAALRECVSLIHGDRSSGILVRGLDIGTGASAIYPLLACALKPDWRFIATELDNVSFNYAESNVRSNGLAERIQVIKVNSEPESSIPPTPTTTATNTVSSTFTDVGELQFGFDRLFANGATEQPVHGTLEDSQPNIEIQFTMCNPPFYTSAEDVAQSEAGKEFGAYGACTGAPVEMITPGGEAAFVSAMVRESVHVHAASGFADTDDKTCGSEAKTGKRRKVGDGAASMTGAAPGPKPESASLGKKKAKTVVRWYTSMLGKVGSVVEVVEMFRELEITNYAITEFVQGHTRRWAVGWCIGAWRLGDDVARITSPNPTLQRLLPPRNILRLPISVGASAGVGAGALQTKLRTILDGVLGLNVHTWATRADADTGALKGAHFIIASATRNTWSRGARRKRERDMTNSDTHNHEPEQALPALVCACALSIPPDSAAKSGAAKQAAVTEGRASAALGEAVVELEVRWLYGLERALLESFGSHLAKKLQV